MFSAESIISVYARNLTFIQQLTAGFSHADSLIQPPVPGNCAHWIVGHLVVYRNRLLTMLEQPLALEESQVARYVRDSAPVLGDEPGLTPFGDLLEALQVSQERLATGVRALTPAVAERVHEYPPMRMSTAEWLIFLLRHEAYHTGQLELLQEVVKQQKAG